ncbi:MAG TPA: bifunctional phosphoglucose/phosphomannose isomerase [Dehalococcoidia bacterium]|nr:bifunctional phosphoglucose/phosphomannose isomerase [Dehalococcoidia bacterium]
MTTLDDPEVRGRLDQDGSYERISGLPEQCWEAWEQTKGWQPPPDFREIDKVIVAGMGGSAIAGDFLQALAFSESRMPVTVVRGYELPAWVDGRTLVIICSHSGNTEEVLSCFEAARGLPAKKLVITTGGRVLELARLNGVAALQYQYPNVPRDAFGHGLVRLLVVAGALGLVRTDEARLRGVVQEMQALREAIGWHAPEDQNDAKKLARGLAGALPLTVGAGYMAPVARRWRTQLNENADVFAFWDELPELDHNLVVGLRHAESILRSTRAVFLDHEGLHARVRKRYGLTQELFERAGIVCQRITFPQQDPLAAQLCAVHFGDLASYYLALLLGVRPVEVENIDWLKDQLARG